MKRGLLWRVWRDPQVTFFGKLRQRVSVALRVFVKRSFQVALVLESGEDPRWRVGGEERLQIRRGDDVQPPAPLGGNQACLSP